MNALQIWMEPNLSQLRKGQETMDSAVRNRHTHEYAMLGRQGHPNSKQYGLDSRVYVFLPTTAAHCWNKTTQVNLSNCSLFRCPRIYSMPSLAAVIDLCILADDAAHACQSLNGTGPIWRACSGTTGSHQQCLLIMAVLNSKAVVAKERHAQTHKHTDTHTQTHSHTDTDTHTHTLTHTHRDTHAHARTRTTEKGI